MDQLIQFSFQLFVSLAYFDNSGLNFDASLIEYTVTDPIRVHHLVSINPFYYYNIIIFKNILSILFAIGEITKTTIIVNYAVYISLMEVLYYCVTYFYLNYKN